MIRVLRRRVALLTDEEQLRRLLSRAASVEERGPSGCPSVDNITFPLLDWRIRVRVNSGPDKVIEFRASKQHTVEAELPSATQWSLHEVSRGTFVELNPVTPTRRPGFRHFGLETNDIGVTTANLKQRGIGVGEPNLSGTKSMLANFTTPDGIQIELVDPRPGSLHRQAMDRWK